MAKAPEGLEIVHVGVAEVARLAPIFDAYRRFEGRRSDPLGVVRFLSERIAGGESVFFLATLRVPTEGPSDLGFLHLHPSFTSTGLARTFVLNDVFVMPEARGRGVGRTLLEAARAHARAAGARRVELRVARANTRAQALYEAMGFERNDGFVHYALRL